VTQRPDPRDVDDCRNLVQRIVLSSYLNKSSRLTEMLQYLCDRVLHDAATDIHELEVGSKVFGRPPHYDTGADNIVRVHASMLRKRLREYFLAEGSHEPLILDIPRGNYAPVFRSRSEAIPQLARPGGALHDTPVPDQAPALPEVPSAAPRRPAWTFWVPTALAAVFAALSLFLFVRSARQDREAAALAKPDNAIMRRF